jgi:hypothetical protein
MRGKNNNAAGKYQKIALSKRYFNGNGSGNITVYVISYQM